MHKAASDSAHHAAFLSGREHSEGFLCRLLKWRTRGALRCRRTRLATCFAAQSSTALFFHSHSGTTPPARCNSRRGTGAIRLRAQASPVRMRSVKSESWFRFCRSNRSAGFVRVPRADRLHKAPLCSAQSARSPLPRPKRFRPRSSIPVRRAAGAESCRAARLRAKADKAHCLDRVAPVLSDR